MSCRKKCGKCDKCELFKADQGPRGFRGSPGPTGPVGPIGPCCTGPTGPGSDVVPTFFPTFKPLAAMFYGIGEGAVGIGDIFDFPLDGPNDPIGRLDSGTFLLPFAGLYRISWEIPINEPPFLPPGPPTVPASHVQSTLTAQIVPDGAFVPVAGGAVGKAVPYSQVVGEVIVEAIRNNFPIRIENTSSIPVTYYAGIPAHPNQRTINIASIVPQKTYAAGILINTVPQVVASAADVTFNQSGLVNNAIGPSLQANVGVVPPTAPHVGLVIEQAGIYVIEWQTHFSPIGPTDGFHFFPYVNGMRVLTEGNFGPGGPPDHANRIRSSNVLQPGDVVTLRNQSGSAIALSNDVPINASLAVYRAFPQ